MTRRGWLRLLAGLPVVGKLAAEPWPEGLARISPGLRADLLDQMAGAVFDEPFTAPATHYVGFDIYFIAQNLRFPKDTFHKTIAEAMECVVPGRGDRILVAPGHQEQTPLEIPEGTTVVGSSQGRPGFSA